MTQWNLVGREERAPRNAEADHTALRGSWLVDSGFAVDNYGQELFRGAPAQLLRARSVFRKILFEISLRLHMLPKGLRFWSVGKLDDALAKCRAHANRLRRQVPDPFDLASEARISASLQHGILFHRGTPRGSSQEMVLGWGVSGGGAGFCARGLLWSGVFQVAV